MQELQEAILSRRTFAIISHPDAGKTTLTEKLLLYSGMLQTAGMVKGRKGRRAAVSDWMAMEQERGISITSSAMQFTYKGVTINVLDTPGHEDFSEDTYRTLTAADCAIMVLDAAKGVEKQTKKLFAACRLRNIPILTFINKMDMPGKDPLELMEEVESVLGINAFAYNWPIGRGKSFQGVVDRGQEKALFFTKTSQAGALKAEITSCALQDPEVKKRIDPIDYELLCQELELLATAGNPFSTEDFLQGKVSPLFFGSALTNFGVEPFFDAFLQLAPPPSARPATRSDETSFFVDPVHMPFSGYVFKLQANMDKQHRDHMAFIRICSGRFERNLLVHNERTGKTVRLSRPHGMIAGERNTLDVAYPGDVIGVINPACFAIGDTLSVDGGFCFQPLPQFQPEIFATLRPKDVGKRKAFDKGVLQLVEEGAIQLLKPYEGGNEPIFAVVGQLQFDVMQYRLKEEYGVDTLLSSLPYQASSWIMGDEASFQKTSSTLLVQDRQGRLMGLFTSSWEKQYTIKQNPNHTLLDVWI
ncbi:MAG: peptide chain release factor 3 [Chlamydiae bacterium]|nr:peptide chain release factor 3 [Chlamydiota bacterium]